MNSDTQKRSSQPSGQVRLSFSSSKRALVVLLVALAPFFLMACGSSKKEKPALNAVAWGDGIFVAVGENGHILTSPDGGDWKKIAGKAKLPTLTSVVWTGEAFVASGGGGNTIWWTSPTEWSVGTVGAEVDIYGLATGPSGVIAVGAGGAVFLSADGVAWESIDTGIAETLRQATWGEGKYVAVGEEGAIWTSPEARIWTRAETPLEIPIIFLAVAYNEGLFFASGADGTILESAKHL